MSMKGAVLSALVFVATARATTQVYQEGVRGSPGSAHFYARLVRVSPYGQYCRNETYNVIGVFEADRAERGVFVFDVSDIPTGATVRSCSLTVTTWYAEDPTPGHLFRIRGEHTRDGACPTWTEWASGEMWALPGAGSPDSDYDPADAVAFDAPDEDVLRPGDPFTFPDLTALCQDAVTHRGGQLRLLVKQDDEAAPDHYFAMALPDDPRPRFHPKLTLEFDVEPPLCGNSMREFDETCDDGNRVDGDGCSADCQVEGCPLLPREGCRRSTVPGAALLRLKNNATVDDKDAILWRWRRGATTAADDFGDPIASDHVVVCLYDDENELRLGVNIAPGGTCDDRPCWTSVPDGFQYKNRSRLPQGVKLLTLRAGADGAARIVLTGSGRNFMAPPVPFGPLPARVQLFRTDGPCFESVFVAPSAGNTAKKFGAHGD